MVKELNYAREQLLEKDEEIVELKSERNNIKVSMKENVCLIHLDHGSFSHGNHK